METVKRILFLFFQLLAVGFAFLTPYIMASWLCVSANRKEV